MDDPLCVLSRAGTAWQRRLPESFSLKVECNGFLDKVGRKRSGVDRVKPQGLFVILQMLFSPQIPHLVLRLPTFKTDYKFELFVEV